MVHTDYLTVITQSTTLNGLHNIYLVNATGPTGIDITLPQTGGSDGINYELIREDISSCIVTIHTSGGNIITQNLSGTSGSTGNINLIPQTSIKLKSLDNRWYVVSNSSTQRTNSKILYSTTFGSNNTTNYYQVRGGVTVPVCYFPYNGTSTEIISSVECVLGVGANFGATGTLILRNGSTGAALGPIYGTGAFSLGTNVAPGPKFIFSINNFTGLPTTSTVLELDMIVAGSNAIRVNIYSLTVK